jgi:hypothetical protein
MPRALALTDEEMNTLYRLAGPLDPHDRGAFLEAVAERLRGVEILGPGIVARIAAETQRQYFDPPVIERVPSRWDRAQPDFQRASRRTY